MDTNKANKCPVPNGVLVIVGGHENKGEKQEKEEQEAHHSKEGLESFVHITGKKNATIEVITTGSSEGAESFKDYERAFLSLGVKQVGHIHHNKREDALSGELERISNADAVYFSGGD